MAHKKSKIIFKTIVIGKKVVILFIILLLVLVFVITMLMVLKQNFEINKNTLYMNSFAKVIPTVGVNHKQTQNESEATNTDYIIPFNSFDNFSILPCFFKSNPAKNKTLVYAKEQPVQAVVADVTGVKIDEQNNSYKHIEIKNETKYNVDVNSLLQVKTVFNLEKNKPAILIVHTHGTESYTSDKADVYSSARTTDKNINMIRVGRQLKTELEKYGFNVIHDTNLNDYPSYNSSYTKTQTVIQSYLKKYPSIKCVFDVHRDAIEAEDGTRMKFAAQIGDKKVSQVMIVSGTDGLGLENPNWQQNLSFALKIHSYLNNKYPGFMRPLNLRKERFNMHLTTGSLLFEIGTHGNTLDEALGACEYLAEGIYTVLK